MNPRAAELSSLATGLDELTRRVTTIADAYASADADEVALDLYAVERALVDAHRRLMRTVQSQTRPERGTA